MRIAIVICCVICFQGLYGQKAVIDKITAQVGDELVLRSELEENYALMQDRRGVLPDGIRCSILENLLVSNLLVHQARLDSIEVGDEEVEAQLDDRVDQILSLMNNDLEQFRNYYGMTVSEAKNEFREDLRKQIMAQRMQDNLMSEINVTPSEVKTFFSAIPKDSLPYFNAEVEVRELRYFPQVNPVERQKSIDKITSIKKRILDEGEDFAELASTFSDDRGSARIGGDLGMQKRGTFVPAFEAAAFNLEEGEMSDVVESEFGYHIIQLLERRGNNIHTRHILVTPEITDADIDKAVAHLDSVRTLLMADSLNFSIAVKKFSDESTRSYNNDGRIMNPKTGDTFFEVGDLEPDIFFTIDTMEVGDFSRPFVAIDGLDKKVVQMILLQSRTAPHRANLQQDYSKIRKASIEQKKTKHLFNWVGHKAENTYLYLESQYEGCPNLEGWGAGHTRNMRP